MRIALLTDGVHPYVIGGMQKHSYFLARELARNKHTVYLFHCYEGNLDASKLEFFTEEERKYIKGYVIPFPRNKHYPLHYISESKKYSSAIYKALKPLLPETDFIFAQGFSAWALLEDKHRAKLPPVAVHFHGLEMFQHIPSFKTRLTRPFLQGAVKKNLRKADYVLSFGGEITRILEKIVDKNKIWEIPGGIERTWISDRVHTPSDKLKFVFVGRYERRKGIPELNIAIEKLLQQEQFTMEFIGNIPDEYRILNAAVSYHNKLTSEAEIKQILGKCDVLVCPSYAEGLPNVIMEAMACGLAVIATDVGAVSSLVDSENGWLIKSPNPELICNAMKEAIDSKEDIMQKKSASQSKIKEGYLLENVTAQLLNHIEKAIHHDRV
jgi:glycosyltransferase involved in cell wall biosynthesis